MRFLAFVALFAVSLPLPGQSIDEFFDEFTTEWVRGNPSMATYMRYFKGEEQDRLDRRITPGTRQYALERVALAKRGLERLGAFDRTGLTGSQRVSADLLQWQLEVILEREPLLDYAGFPLNQFRGASTGLPSRMMRIQPLASERDAENFLAALSEVDTRMDEAIAEARRQEQAGIIPPRFILDATIKQMQRFADPSPGANPITATYAEKMERVDSIAADRRVELLEQAETIIAEEIYPAWRKGIAMLESQLDAATNDAGLWRLERGDEAYAYALRYYTTTDLTADQIHEIGLQEVARLEAEMDRLFRDLGRTEGTIAERIAQLHADRTYPEPSSEASRAQIIEDIDRYVRDAEKRAESLFDMRPQAPVVVEPSPTFIENNTAANYSGPAPDGSRPGIYRYPRRLDNMSKVKIRSVTYHETVPGHHFQIALQTENEALPRFRQQRAFGGISAFSEGWGLYAERLAVEQGWYEGDPEGLLDALDSQLFRARRLVVDTGLHAKGWTRQQAIDYGMPVSEVERYVVMPGQACSYMIGQLKIVELREKARTALGDDFSLREFHNLVLGTGIIPLQLLEQEVDAYIAAKQSGEPAA